MLVELKTRIETLLSALHRVVVGFALQSFFCNWVSPDWFYSQNDLSRICSLTKEALMNREIALSLERAIAADEKLVSLLKFPPSVGEVPLAQTFEKRIVVHIVFWNSDLASFPEQLTRIALEAVSRMHASGLVDPTRCIDFVCKACGPFSHGPQQSTRTILLLTVEAAIPVPLTDDFVEAVARKQVDKILVAWSRHYDWDRVRDYPELLSIPDLEFFRLYPVPYRRNFNDEQRFLDNPKWSIPRTFEELERLYPLPYERDL
jgi:hypothetical protein